MNTQDLTARIAGIDDSHTIEIRVGDLRNALNELEYAKKNFKEWQDAVEHYRETLRDRFAMAALPSCMNDHGIPTDTACRYAYEIADAMLAARKGNK